MIKHDSSMYLHASCSVSFAAGLQLMVITVLAMIAAAS